MSFKYYLHLILSLPLLPLIYVQGKRIRAHIPKLPEAKGKTGKVLASTKTEQTIQVLTLGESTIAGVGVERHDQGFTGTLAKELAPLLSVNINWKVYAKSGYTAAQVAHKIAAQIEEKHVDIIVIGLGGNDAFKLNSLQKWTKDIKVLIKKLRLKYPRTPIFFYHMPTIKECPAFTSSIKICYWKFSRIIRTSIKSFSEGL